MYVHVGFGRDKGRFKNIVCTYGIVKVCLGIIHLDFEFPVIQKQKGIPFVHELVFCKPDFFDIPGNPHVHGYYVLVHVCVICNFIIHMPPKKVHQYE